MRRLRAAVAVLAIAALCAGTWAVAVRGVRRSDRPSVDAHRAELAAEARIAAGVVSAWMQDSRSQLNAVKAALQPWMASRGQAAQNRSVLDRYAPLSPNFDGGLIVLDRRSVVVATTSTLAILDGQQRPSAAVSSSIGGQDATSDVYEDPLSHEFVVGMTTPLSGSGGPTGVLLGFTRLPTGSLARVVGGVQEALGHPVDIVTLGGTIVAPVPPSASMVIRRADEAVSPAVLAAAKGTGVLSYVGEAHSDTVASFAPLPDGWTVVLPRPAASLTVTGERATTAAGAAIATVLLGSFVVVIALLALLRRRSANVEEVKQAFLAIAGHELRTPLTVMKGYTELLVERWDDVADDTRRDIVETVGYQVRNLEHLVERLLLGAQLEAGITPSTAHDSVAIGPLLEAAASHQRGIAPTHEFVVDTPDGLSVRADAKALDHVVTNLVENAVKYSPDGGIVTMSADVDGDRVRVTIDDEGIGLPANIDIIFEKFVQREAVDTRVHDEGGVGLGLFIARTLVEQMGGTVRAKRRSPRGASFVVTLPRAS